MVEFAPQEQEAGTLGQELVKGALTSAFTKAASFIHGELTQASMEAVQAMYERHQKQIKAKVDEINHLLKADGYAVAPPEQHHADTFYVDAPGGFTVELGA